MPILTPMDETQPSDRTLDRGAGAEAAPQITADAAPDAMFVLDPKTGAILDVTRGACALFGYSRQAARERTLADVSSGIPPYSAQDAQLWMGRAMAEGPQHAVWHARDKGGRLFWVDANLRRGAWEGRDCLLLSTYDISEYRQAEQKANDRLQLGALLIDMSVAFVAAKASELEGLFGVWLGRIVERVGLDRASVIRISAEDQQVEVRHFYVRVGSGLPPPELRWVRDMPFYSAQVLRGTRLHWTHLPDSLPADALAERAYCERQGVKSALVLPMWISGTLIGALSFVSFNPDFEWPDYLLQRLELAGPVFANALQRYNAEQVMKVNAAQLELALESSGMGVWEWDVLENRIHWSSRVGPIYGHKAGWAPTSYSALSQLIHPDDRQDLDDTVSDCIKGRRTTFHMERRIVWPDGGVHWVESTGKALRDAQGNTIRLLGTVADVTERKQFEQALRESESQFRVMFEQAPLGLAYVDHTFHIVKANRALHQFLGYPEHELHGVSFVDITHPDDIEQDAKQASKMFDGTLEHYEMEKRYLKKSGETVWGKLRVTLPRDDQGRIQHILGMVEDITAHKEIEDQLRQVQKMDALGQLAGGVAHDFNNLLMAIKGYGEITLGALPKDHSLRGNIEEIIQAGDRAAALTRQLLAFSRKQVRRPKVIDLGSIVDEMQKMLRRLIGENIKLLTSVEAKLGHVLADPGQIEQIVVNLLVNARDAMPKGGKVMVEIANVFLDAEYARHHVEVTPGRHVMLAVSDTGCGMSRAVQQRIFEPFFTTKEPGRGTGLGLSTVYGIVKQSGGHIWVYSEEGVGTKFKVYLPCVEQPEEAEAYSTHETEAPGGSETILLVEDDDSVRRMIRGILKDKGYDLIVARDGEEALSIWRRDHRDFQLLLTDVVMPRMSGRELCETLRRQSADFKVLYMSGYAQDSVMHNGVLNDNVSLIEKPFTKNELLRRIREVIAAP